MKRTKKLLLMLLVLTLTVGGVITTNAATTTINMATSGTKAKVITKTGLYKLNNRGDFNYGYLKFKAPKTGTYVFTFNNLHYKGDSADMKKDDYFYEFSNKYNRDIYIEIQTGSDKYGWETIKFDNEKVFNLVNSRKAIYETYLHGNYETLEDAVYAYANNEVSEEETLRYLDGAAPEIQLTLKMKKGTVIRILTQDSSDKTYCTMKIKKK